MSGGNSSDFLLGILIGSVIGLAGVSLLKGGKGKKGFDLQMLEKALMGVEGKGKSAKGGDQKIAEVLEWAFEGIELWKKLKKKRG